MAFRMLLFALVPLLLGGARDPGLLLELDREHFVHLRRLRLFRSTR